MTDEQKLYELLKDLSLIHILMISIWKAALQESLKIALILLLSTIAGKDELNGK